MVRFLIRRIFYSLVVVILVTLVVFVLSRASGDPRTVFLNEYTTQEQYDEWGRQWGLDKPVIFQYFIWLGNAARGNLGNSLRENRPVVDVIRERVPATVELAAGSFLFALLIGIPLGVLSAVRRGAVWDYAGRTLALFGQALPPFWLGIMLILIFAVQLDWLPTGRRGGLDHYILPAITLGWLTASGLLRLVRSSMLEVLDSEYVKLARAKGVGGTKVLWKHAFRNALIGPLTYSALVFVAFLTGAVVTETVFAWPGLGRLAVTSVNNLDLPVLSGVVLVLTSLYVSVNLMTDMLYAVIDPRIRLE
jgi:peptide/nickel transport system permease protein